jgi:transposase
MWSPSRAVQIWLYRQPVDLRKSFDGLSALAKNQLLEDPLSGAVFVFVNRRRTQMRCLYFDGDGYCLWSKRLERGRFQVRWSSKDKASLDMSTLRLLVEGIEPRTVHRYKRYRPRQATEARLSL